MRPEADESPPLEWGDEGLRATAHANMGVGADADLAEDLRFRSGVVRLIRKRLVVTTADEEGQSLPPAVFFLLPSAPTSVDESQLKTAPMLDNGVTPIEGHLWFVGPVVAQGFGFEVRGWDDAGVFKFARDDLGIGKVPAIVFETRTSSPEARFYPEGLSDPDAYELLRIGGEAIGLDEILAVVEDLHKQCLVTPGVQATVGKLWSKAGQHWASPKAEAMIQLYLRAGLVGAFPSCVVRAEQSQATGRLDLEVEEADWEESARIIRHALLELKVLRSYGSTGVPVTTKETKDWVEGGVKQAAAYRQDRGTRASALCCFDMRVCAGRADCFVHVRSLAKRLSVTLCSWPIFASARRYQDYLTT